MVREILNRHSRLNITYETHYFDDLRPRLGDPSGMLGPEEHSFVLNYFAQLATTNYAFRGRPSERVATAQVPVRGASADHIFARYCIDECRGARKQIWGEKTPRHLYRADDILAVFPQARFVALVRDPRGVVASYRNWSLSAKRLEVWDGVTRDSLVRETERVRRSYNLTLSALLWRSATNLTLQLQARVGPSRLCLIRFEDLLQAPRETIAQLSAWLGVEFEEDMLNVAAINSSFSEQGAREGMDAEAADRWREALSANEIGYVEWLCGGVAGAIGYPAAGVRAQVGFLIVELLKAPIATLRAAAANRRRIGNLGAFVLARLSGLFGSRRSRDRLARSELELDQTPI